MVENPIVQSVLSVFAPDTRVQRELDREISQMLATEEKARVATDEIGRIMVYSQARYTQDLIALHAIEASLANTGIPPEEYVAFNQIQIQELAQHLAYISHRASCAISQRVR